MLEKICNDKYKSIVIDKTGLAPEVIERDLNDSDSVTVTIATDRPVYNITCNGLFAMSFTGVTNIIEFVEKCIMERIFTERVKKQDFMYDGVNV